MTTKNKKEDLNIKSVWTRVKNTIKDSNEFALEATDDVLDGVLKSSGQWQNVLARATKGGLELTARQQDINYETLETLKKQLTTGFNRFKKIFRG